MEEEEDDIYDPEESLQVNAPQSGNTRAGTSITGTAVKDERMEDDLEEGEEEEEADDSDSDIDIITDRKDGSKPEPPAQPSRYSTIKNIPARTASASAEPSSKAQQIKSETPRKGTPPKSGADYPAISTSTIDVNAKPVFDPAGKLITELDMDNDFGENDKPWRRPGSDITDYFNYGFDEFTWASYCLKQNTLRKEVQDEKKQLEDMMTMGMPGAMPGMPPMPGAMGMPSMPGMPDMPPEMMQQMMAQFMPQGANMDPSMFMQQMQQEMSNQPGANSGNQGPAYGGGPGFGSQSQNQQGMNYGFDNRGGYAGGRGRGGNRRNW